MAEQQQPLSERFREGKLHARIHLEASASILGEHIAPINRSLTVVGMCAVMPNGELKERALNILKHHGWLPTTLKMPDPQYLIATPSGIQVKDYAGLMDLQFLTNYERILLHEFLERREYGEYPDL